MGCALFFCKKIKNFSKCCTRTCKKGRLGTKGERTTQKVVRDLTKKDAVTQKAFCRAYLRTMDPDRAAALSGTSDGDAMLRSRDVRDRLERMRAERNVQILREDAVRHLAELAFGRVNDAAALALAGERGADSTADLDLSAVSELKVTDKGVEVKFIDRIRALETLCELLENNGGGAAEFFRALEEASEETTL